MADAEQEDLVATYHVDVNGVVHESYAPVKKALESGYRVIDVIQTPTSPGGSSSFSGLIAVTVVMTKSNNNAYASRRST